MYIRLLLSLFLLILIILINQTAINAQFTLTVIHNNDLHCSYLPIDPKFNSECLNYLNNSKCVAGVARIVAEVKNIRQKYENDNVLFLNAGDEFQGTVFYSLFKSEIVSDFIQMIKYDVMALGNHEFDNGPSELEKFILHVNNSTNNYQLPILAANIEFDKNSLLNKLVKKSMIKTFNHTKVALIGLYF